MNDKAIKNLLKALKGKSKPQGYDTTATVTRVEGSTCWVHIPGGVAETPCKLSIDAKEGDTVQVRVAGGKAHLTGNVTAPPTDDSTAKKAVESSLYAQSMASAAQTAVSSVKTTAEEAAETAEEAAETAETALTSADGKNTVYYATSLPSGGDYADGDLCFLQNSSGICKGLYVYNGSSWVLKALDADALSVGSLSAISANLGTVTAGTINGVTISGNAITGGTITGATISGSTISGGTISSYDNYNSGIEISEDVITFHYFGTNIGYFHPGSTQGVKMLAYTGWLLSPPTIQTGSYTFPFATADTTESRSVIFAETMATTPKVFVQAVTSVPDEVSCGVRNVSSTGFTLYAHRSTAVSTTVYWVAVCAFNVS